jgi:hypothetical protein
MQPFTRDALPGRVVFAAGALDRLPEEVARLDAERPLIIADGVAAPLTRLQALLPGAAGIW